MACILCSANGYAEIGDKRGYTIVKCVGCGFVYTTPLPAEDELATLTKKKSSNFKPHVSISRTIRYRFFASSVKRLFPKNKKIRLLEVGCNHGNFLDVIKKDANFAATGIDLNPAALEYARGRGLDARDGTLESHNFPSGSFDVVVALHVIEHFHDPVRTLSEMNRVLSEGGLLISIVPCVTHIKARLAGINWKYFGPPSHLWYFSPATFAMLLEKTGFTPTFSSSFYNRAHLKTIAKKAKQIP
ncbi:MAG: class I SAM-dependent methyltransferase [Deltaproteobacteria bacterium]|nr:class I SAM-dependent methyltransferase [Deltaproteobacteria bacterium]